MFTQGQQVRFNGKTNHINDLVYAGQIATVDFHLYESPTLVRVYIKSPKQRKPRSVVFHMDSLEAVSTSATH
jgi:hypothetical protein